MLRPIGKRLCYPFINNKNKAIRFSYGFLSYENLAFGAIFLRKLFYKGDLKKAGKLCCFNKSPFALSEASKASAMVTSISKYR